MSNGHQIVINAHEFMIVVHEFMSIGNDRMKRGNDSQSKCHLMRTLGLPICPLRRKSSQGSCE